MDYNNGNNPTYLQTGGKLWKSQWTLAVVGKGIKQVPKWIVAVKKQQQPSVWFTTAQAQLSHQEGQRVAPWVIPPIKQNHRILTLLLTLQTWEVAFQVSVGIKLMKGHSRYSPLVFILRVLFPFDFSHLLLRFVAFTLILFQKSFPRFCEIIRCCCFSSFAAPLRPTLPFNFKKWRAESGPPFEPESVRKIWREGQSDRPVGQTWNWVRRESSLTCHCGCLTGEQGI